MLISGASEYPTFVALPYVLLGLVSPVMTAGRQLTSVALAGLSSITRSNQVFAWLVLATAALGAPTVRRRWAVAALALFTAILLLPLAHNLYYGGQFVVTTSAATIKDNLLYPPSQLPAILGDDASRRAMTAHVAHLLYLVPGAGSHQRALFRVPQLLWVVAVIAAWRASAGLLVWIVFALPWLYLAPHVFYQVNIYYPRHIVIAHLAFALGAIFSVASTGRRTSADQSRRWLGRTASRNRPAAGGPPASAWK
jgi:hypothetical protein